MFLINLMIVFGYFMANTLNALILLDDPGLVSIVPSMGILVMGLSLFGRKALPGSAIAIAFVCWTSYTSGNIPDWAASTTGVLPLLSVIKLIAVVIAAYYCRRHLLREEIVSDFYKVFRFYISVGLIPALLEPSVGVTLQFLITGNPVHEILWGWSIWVVFNVFGILAFLPFTLVVFKSQRKEFLPITYRYGLPFLTVLFLGLLFVHFLMDYEQRESQSVFTKSSDQLVSNMERAIERQVITINLMTRALSHTGIESLSDYYQFVENTFSDELNLQATNLAIHLHGDRLEWAQTYLNETYGETVTFFDADTEGRRVDLGAHHTDYLPIVAVYPFKENRGALGLNLLGRRGLEGILKRSMETQRSAATFPIKIVQKPDASAVVTYVPFRSTLNGKDEQFFFNVVLLVDQILADPLKNLKLDFRELALSDVTDPSQRKVIDLGIQDTQFQEATNTFNFRDPYRYEANILFLDRIWHLLLVSQPRPVLFAENPGTVLLVLTTVILIILYGGYQISQFYQDKLIEKEVLIRTEDLRLARDQAEQASKVKNEFLAVTNHELRTPLNGIIATSELLLEGDLKPNEAQLAKMIQGSGRILLDLINDVLDFARMEAGKLRLDIEPFKPAELLEQWDSIFRIQAEAKGLKLEFIPQGDLNMPVEGDWRRINQILINFLGNAIKFTEKGSVSVRVFLSPVNDWKYEYGFSITDTGPGISDKKMERLFEAFEQDEGVRTRKHEGSGLGLAICKRLADAMNGRINVKSDLGKGTTSEFKLLLTKSNADLPERDDPSTSALQICPISKRLEEIRVLVVEDNVVNQKVVRLVLGKLGVEPEIAGDGHFALSLLEAKAFDIIFLDIHLPDMDGLEVSRRFRKMENEWSQKIPIIALTANTTEEMRKLCAEAGMQGFLSKPIQVQKMKSIFEEWSVTENNLVSG